MRRWVFYLLLVLGSLALLAGAAWLGHKAGQSDCLMYGKVMVCE